MGILLFVLKYMYISLLLKMINGFSWPAKIMASPFKVAMSLRIGTVVAMAMMIVIKVAMSLMIDMVVVMAMMIAIQVARWLWWWSWWLRWLWWLRLRWRWLWYDSHGGSTGRGISILVHLSARRVISKSYQPKCTLTSLAIESPKQHSKFFSASQACKLEKLLAQSKSYPPLTCGRVLRTALHGGDNDYGGADYFSAKGVCSVRPVGLRQKHSNQPVLGYNFYVISSFCGRYHLVSMESCICQWFRQLNSSSFCS